MLNQIQYLYLNNKLLRLCYIKNSNNIKISYVYFLKFYKIKYVGEKY